MVNEGGSDMRQDGPEDGARCSNGAQTTDYEQLLRTRGRTATVDGFSVDNILAVYLLANTMDIIGEGTSVNRV